MLSGLCVPSWLLHKDEQFTQGLGERPTTVASACVAENLTLLDLHGANTAQTLSRHGRLIEGTTGLQLDGTGKRERVKPPGSLAEPRQNMLQTVLRHFRQLLLYRNPARPAPALLRLRACSALLTFSMLHVFLLALLLPYAPSARSHPIHWLRKISPATRDDNGWLWGWAWASDGTVSVVDRSPAVTFPARPASFGAELPDPLLGYVIPLSAFTAPCPPVPSSNRTGHPPFDPDPVLGCPELCLSGPHEPDASETWIALVQRGGCPFVYKARQAQKLGAKAMVVGGDRANPDALLNMYSEREPLFLFLFFSGRALCGCGGKAYTALSVFYPGA